MGRITSYRQSGGRYLSLRIIAVIFTGLGAVLSVAGSSLLAYALYPLLAGVTRELPRGQPPFVAHPVSVPSLSGGLGGALAVVWALGLLVSGLQFLAMGALSRLAIHVEENTRASAQCLEKLRSLMEPRAENVGPQFRS